MAYKLYRCTLQDDLGSFCFTADLARPEAPVWLFEQDEDDGWGERETPFTTALVGADARRAAVLLTEYLGADLWQDAESAKPPPPPDKLLVYLDRLIESVVETDTPHIGSGYRFTSDR